MDAAAAKRREERVKLFATFLSNVGVALVVTGILAPTFTGGAEPIVIALAIIGAMASHGVAQVMLHWVVRSQPAEEA